MSDNNTFKLNDDVGDVFGEETFVLCDLCGESIDIKTKQIYAPKIYCPSCLTGITQRPVK